MKLRFLLIGCALLSCVALLPGRARTQRAATPGGEATLPGEPLKVRVIRRQADVSLPGGKRAADARRQSGLAVEVENTSGKAVSYLEIWVGLQSAKRRGAPPPLRLRYGQVAARSSVSARPALFRPGATLSLEPSHEQYDAAAGRPRAGSYFPSPADEVSASIRAVIFEDGTAWARGLYHYRDPDDPLRWNVLDKSLGGAASALTGTPRFTKASYAPVSPPASARSSTECGRYGGYHIVSCCDDQYIAFSDFVVPDPNPDAAVGEFYNYCPISTGGGYCVTYLAEPCPN